ncbi:MAG: hypothetical protein ABI206_05010 [Antricoccus sp.]
MEPPAHTRLRRLIASAFRRGHAERLRPQLAVLAEELADQLTDSGPEVDLIIAYAEPLPVAVIGAWLGVARQDWPRVTSLIIYRRWPPSAGSRWERI